MRKKVWILNHYAGGMFFSEGGRHYNFAKYLKPAGYETVVFCANTKHGKAEKYFDTEKLWEEHQAENIGVPFIFVKARTYIGNGKQRILNMVDFYRNVQKTAKEYAKINGKPDIILASSVHPLTLVAGEKLAKHFGVKCICEVRDLWPESIIVYSDKWKKSNPFIKLLYRGEKQIYKKADAVIFTMEGAYDYIAEQGWEKNIPREKVFFINNGVDLEAFDYNKEHYKIDDPDLENPDIFKVVYAGSIRKANNLGLLLDAAKKIKDPTVKFLIWGNGNEREALEKRLKDENIHNVVFKGSVGKQYIPYIMSHAQLNLMNYPHEAAELYRFGSSQNKLFESMASGVPTVCNVKIAHSLFERYHCGISINLNDAEQYADEILKMKNLSSDEYNEMSKNAKKGAADYDFEKLTQKLIDIIEEV